MDGNLNKYFQKYLPRFHWQRFEPSGGLGAGVCDLNGCCDGHEVWVELKAVKGWRVDMRETKDQPSWQVSWIERRLRAGGKVFIAARQADTLYLIAGAAARLLLTERIDNLPWQHRLLTCHNGPSRWQWPEIARIFCGQTTQ